MSKRFPARKWIVAMSYDGDPPITFDSPVNVYEALAAGKAARDQAAKSRSGSETQ